jgi:tetratricopeptide (TPR) repeat protein
MHLTLRCHRSFSALALAVALAFALSAAAQAPSGQTQGNPGQPQSTAAQTNSPTQPKPGKPASAKAGLDTPRPPKPPALIDPAGPSVSLQSSEALFDVAVALNACGYDNGLETSDPIRARVREQVEQQVQQSAPAREARDKLCLFINQHRLSEARRDLAQYVSLALYLNPPPELTASVDEQDLPPDSTQVLDMLPLLRTFATAAQLHLIWIANRPAYEEESAKLHDPLTRMILDTNVYLKLPAATYSGSRFLVVLEPLLSPAETNARVYGTDYVVVASPVNGSIHMQDVRHTYLHYMIEPLLYSRATAMDRLLPILKTVRDAPLDYLYRSDIVSLVIECMIRAIEARTMETGVVEFKIPADTRRENLPRVQHEHDLTLQQAAAVRQRSVDASMQQGYVLTQYFYEQLRAFESGPESLKEAIGPMVYGMDVDQQVHRARDVHFAEQGEGDVIRRPGTRSLDLAEAKLKQGDADGARLLAQKALKDHTADTARADYLLALTWLMKGDMESAANDFAETVRLTSDPRLLAWSHIYLGRIHDVEDEREEALAEYHTALSVRDGQQDTRSAAEKGIAQPFALPHHSHPVDEPDASTESPASPASSSSAPAAQPHR